MLKRSVRLVAFAVGLSANAAAPDVSVEAPAPTVERATVAQVQVEKLGEVHLSAERIGTRLKVQAASASGAVVGRADTVVGLSETPLFVQTPDGMVRIVIHWK